MLTKNRIKSSFDIAVLLMLPASKPLGKRHCSLRSHLKAARALTGNCPILIFQIQMIASSIPNCARRKGPNETRTRITSICYVTSAYKEGNQNVSSYCSASHLTCCEANRQVVLRSQKPSKGCKGFDGKLPHLNISGTKETLLDTKLLRKEAAE